MNTLKKLFGTMLVLGLVSGLASSAVAASFTAASVEPVVWLAAGVGVTTGGTFTWADQSDGGATHDATQTNANRHPSLQTNVINGHSVVRFDAGGGAGNPDWLQIADHADLDIGTAAGKGFTVFLVLNVSDTAQKFFLEKRGGDCDYCIFNEGTLRWFTGNGELQYSPIASAGNFQILAFSLDQTGAGSGTKNTWTDGVADNDNPQAYGNKEADNDQPLYIGRHGALDNDLTFDGDFAEIVIFNTALNSDDLLSTGIYLSDKYGLTTGYAADADGDGVGDDADQCADTPDGEAVDANGCSDSQKDSDNDGVSDAADQCAGTPDGEAVDGNGCSDSQRDSDNDGVADNADNCADTPAGAAVDANGCDAFALIAAIALTPGEQGVQGKVGSDGAAGAAGATGAAGENAPCVSCADVATAAADLACKIMGVSPPSTVSDLQDCAQVIVNSLQISANICDPTGCDIGAEITAALDAKLNE